MSSFCNGRAKQLIYVLTFLLLAACAFIAVLYRRNLSPNTFLYSAMSRFATPPASLCPSVPQSLYNRAHYADSLPHHPIVLNLPTSDGSGQACHPDVVYLECGFGPEAWPYWMACTPYPHANTAVENPELLVSRDGIAWFVPDGLHNPIVPSPNIPSDHNSDPDLFFHDGQLWLVYRSTTRSNPPNPLSDRNTLSVTQSNDGVRWSPPKEILCGPAGAQFLSPAIVHDGAQFLMWTVELHQNKLHLARRSSADGFVWGPPTPATLTGLPVGRSPWHLDVIQEIDKLSAILVSCTGLGGAGARLHYACSYDQGLTWRAGDFLLDQAYEFEAKLQYRASFHKMQTHPERYQLWYSAASSSGIFSIAYATLVPADGDPKWPPAQIAPRLETLTFAK